MIVFRLYSVYFIITIIQGNGRHKTVGPESQGKIDQWLKPRPNSLRLDMLPMEAGIELNKVLFHNESTMRDLSIPTP